MWTAAAVGCSSVFADGVAVTDIALFCQSLRMQSKSAVNGFIVTACARLCWCGTLSVVFSQINPENYHYHRGLQCALLHRADLITLTACDLPSSTISLLPEQV